LAAAAPDVSGMKVAQLQDFSQEVRLRSTVFFVICLLSAAALDVSGMKVAQLRDFLQQVRLGSNVSFFSVMSCECCCTCQWHERGTAAGVPA
jgi:hypothetical protein